MPSGSKAKMKVWVGKYKFVVLLSLFSSSLGVSGEDRTTTCDGVQDQFNSLKISVNMAVEKLAKKVDDVAGYYMRNKVRVLEDEVNQLKADNKKIEPLMERVQQLEAETQKIQTLTEDVQQLKTNDEKITEKMDEVAGNMDRNISAITEEVQGLKTENQIILEDQRDVKAKLRILWEPVEKSLSVTFINEMVTSPKAKLYRGANFTGDFEDYTFETATWKGGCHNLQKLGNKVKSVDTFGKCVRLFDYGGCQGRSVAVYPGSGNAENVLNPNMTKVSSIGPCLAEEFEDFDFKDGTKQIIGKNSSNPRKYFPDSVQFYSREKENKAIAVYWPSFSLNLYLLGPGNRLEFLRAWIYPKHLKISQPAFEMQNTSYFSSVEKNPGDIVGYGIPPSLGGPVSETYNAFPQTNSGNKKWTELTSEIRPFLEGGGSEVYLHLNFAYEDGRKKRPTGFYFWIAYVRNYNYEKISYGRVKN